jgi:thiol-disulfide isomerase/thioredoxin
MGRSKAGKFAILLAACAAFAAARGEDALPEVLTSANLLAKAKGRVLVVLLGMESCPNTRRGTEVLAEYAGQRPDGVMLARVDVPPPGGEVEPVAEWKHPFPCLPDARRRLATRLEFFFYPTLYILDRDGTVRYAGGTEAESLRRMVGEILAEKPGGEKRIYTPPLPAIGAAAAPVWARALDGRELTLAELRGVKGTFLYFSSTSCPFSVEGLAKVAKLAEEFKGKGIGFAVVNKPEAAEDVRRVCAEQNPGVPVLLDEKGEICKAYGVDPVPFCFVLDAADRVAARKPFTFESAATALHRLLREAEAEPECEGAG